jgi:Cu/Ag efflux protein CusF
MSSSAVSGEFVNLNPKDTLLMKKTIIALMLAAGLVNLPALAADPAPAKATPAYVMGDTIRAEVEVVSIDLPTRKVGLKDDSGQVTEVVVGKEVRNLAQVKVGDRVVAQYARALSIKLKKGPGIRVTEEKDDAARAAQGEKPAAALGREIHFIADVIKVDTKAKMIAIKGAKGNVFDLNIKDKDLLSQIKVGDQVEGTYLQVLALGVQGPAGRK